MKVPAWLSAFLCVVILASFSPVQEAQAAPSALPTSATFTVNSNADTNEYDSYFTLREAMLAANGTFTRSYSAAERAQMAGCTFDLSGNVTGGCGLGGDTILFAAAVTQINLLTPLPRIIKNGLLIIGNAGKPVIDLKAGVDDGFFIQADNVWLYSMTIINQTGIGSLIGTDPWSAHKGTRVVGNYLGVTPDAASCSDPAITSRPYFALSIWPGTGTAAPGDGTAYIYENVIGCSNNDGISISNAAYVYIGQDPSGSVRPNYIGVTRSGANIGNLAAGIVSCCSLTDHGNVIVGNKIGYNAWSGLSLVHVSETTVSNNEVHHNVQQGIALYSSNRITLANNLIHHNGASGILLGLSSSGTDSTFFNTITGGASYENNAAGITEVLGVDKNSWSKVSIYGNNGLGIDKGANGSVDAPPLAVTGITPTANGVLVNGTFTSSSSFLTTYHIELFRTTRDSSGYGEGKFYIGSVNLVKSAPGTYSWSIPDPLMAVCYTATLTVMDPTNPLNASSSEFSANLGVQCNQTFIPAVFR